MVAKLVGKARERILVILAELVCVKVRGLARAGQPDTNEAGLVVGEHHPVLHARALGFALRAWLGGQPMHVLVLGGCSLFVAGLCVLRVPSRPEVV